MLIIDERTLEPIDGVSDCDGVFRYIEMPLTAIWVVDENAVTERRVVREYPNGGKDVETVETSPEKGHWEVKGPNGKDFTDVVDVPKLASRQRSPFEFSERVKIFHRWEPDEAEEAARNDERRNLIDGMIQSGFVEGTDDALCELYEISLSQQDVMDEQDAAICALYEMIGE